MVDPANASDPDSGRCFWQLTAGASRGGSAPLFLLLMDPGALSPSERRVALRLGGAAAPSARYELFDQLGSQTAPLGTLSAGGGDPVVIAVPAGSARFLTLRRSA